MDALMRGSCSISGGTAFNGSEGMLLPPADDAFPGPADAVAGERPMKRRLGGAPAAEGEAAPSPTADAMTGRLSGRLTATLALSGLL